MEAPPFLLPRPPFDLSEEKRAAFEALFRSAAGQEFIDYSLAYPKWQFLSYLCDTKQVVLHGSQDPSLPDVEPRQARDVRDFSSRRAIYATTDGLWVIFFAILDRRQYPQMALFNSCFQVRTPPGGWSEPFYFFSITRSVLLQKPWCPGAVYILPRRSFLQEPPQTMADQELVFPHWISTRSARPIAKVRLEPQDFPFLDQIHGHDDEKLTRLAAADPNGFPWPEALDP
jgi:hypothetical protein